MTTLPYYTYTQGAVVQKALNAIATFFSSSSFGDYLQICIMLGLAASTFTFMISRNPKDIIKWMVVFFSVPLFLISMKARVPIIDKTEPGAVYVVDNVPYLVAVPTWFFSSMMVGMTEGVESIFTTSDDERYGRTGMLFGSELYRLSRQSNVHETKLKKNWNDYFQNCIIGDIHINHKYSWKELFSAPDMFAFLAGKPQSPLRGLFMEKQDFKTCKEALPLISKEFSDAAGENANLLAQHLFGKNANKYKPQMMATLQKSYQTFISISTSASNTLKQNMALNAVRYSIDTMSPTENALNYAYTQNKLQTTSMWASLGLMAREYLPMMHTMLFMLFACLGFFIAGAAMLPGLTMMVLSNYVKTFAYLATWPALFAILNAIQLWGLEELSTPVSGKFGGLVLSNANAMDELHSRFAWITGALMISVPAIAGGILKGGSAVMSSMNYQLAGMINSTNARASAAAASGNLDFGNTQMDNQSYHNTNANKFDDNTLTRTGHTTTQNSDGSLTTTHHNDGGRTTYDAQGTTSKGNFQAMAQSTVQQGLNTQYSNTQQALTQTMTQVGQNLQGGMALNDRWNDTVSKNLSYGEGNTSGLTTQVTEGMNDVNSAINTVQETTGWSKEQSQAYLQSAYGGFEVGVGSGKSLGFFNAGANGGVKWSDDERTAYSHMTNDQKTQLEQATSQYTEGANSVVSAGQQVDNKDTRSSTEQYAHDFAMNYGNTKTLNATAANSESDLNALSTTISRMDNDSATFTANHMQGFQNYLESTVKPDDVERLMTAHQPEDLAEVKEAYQLYMQTEDFEQSIGLSGNRDTNVKALGKTYNDNAPSSSTKPKLTPGQGAIIEKGHEEAWDNSIKAREDMLNVKQTGGLFNDERFNKITTDTEQQQTIANEQITKPVTPLVDLSIKTEVEAETTRPEPPNYVQTGQSYPSVPAYTKKPE